MGIQEKQPVEITDVGDYAAAGAAVRAILSGSGINFRNARTVIKPNILSAKPPTSGVTTHPSLVKAAVEHVLDSGGRPMVGDNPGVGGYGKTDLAGEISGIKEASLGHFVNFARDTVSIETGSVRLGAMAVSRQVMDADIIINMPKFKTHALTVLTGGIKNMFGMVAGADKSRVHSRAPTPRQFSEAIVDIYRVRPPDFAICDAVIGMEGNGPTGGRLRKIGKIISAANSVELDAVMAMMMGVNPHRVHLLEYAAKKGLGKIDPAEMGLSGPVEKISGFKLPFNFRFSIPSGIGATLVNRFLFGKFSRSNLFLASSKCTKCGICGEHCPAGAMRFSKGNFPAISEDKCISCFCCLELCPENAWEIGGFLEKFRRLRN